jgi:thaumarchaeosortase
MIDDGNSIHNNRLIFLDIKQLSLLAILLWPILLSYLLYSNTFILSWNEGRGGFLIASILALVEIFGSKTVIGVRKLIILIVLAALVSLYFCSLPFGVSDFLLSNGKSLFVPVGESWAWMWDYAILALYFLVCLGLAFGRKCWLRTGGAATLYLVGYCIILSLDSFFPYDTLGMLQSLVPIYLGFNEAILNSISLMLNLEPHFSSESHGNMLVLHDLQGPFVMEVYWPSAGVHSTIIFSLLMLAFLLKRNIAPRRLFVYFVLGIFGTVSINAVRIILLSLYAVMVSSDQPTWEAFHSIAGEVIFIPWLIFYLTSVTYREMRYQRQMLKSNLRPNGNVLTDHTHQYL